MRALAIVAALGLAGCASGEAPGVETIAPILPAIACPVLASRLYTHASVYEGPEDIEVIARVAAVQAAALEAGCAGPEWDAASQAWADAVAR